MYDINRRFRDLGEEVHPNYDEHKTYLVRCIKHQQLLRRVVENINKFFSSILFLQLGESILLVSSSLYRLSKKPPVSSESTLDYLYLFGSLTELWLYCAIGNEMHHQASILPDSLYLSNWTDSTPPLREDITFILASSQQAAELIPFDLLRLDFDLFIRMGSYETELERFNKLMMEC
ncbi:hypothetical protein JTB14_017959 [Gonioctena quinquepunctata]|nr:hypothetical protein JTB14_017959 [Gonioctena quinquepunctata]